MKKTLVLSALFLLMVQISPAQPSSDVWNLVVDLDNALVKKDSAKLKTLLTDDFIGAVPTGQSFNRALYIKYHCKPNIGLLSVKQEGQEKATIRIYGSTAIVNRRVEVDRKSPDGVTRNLMVQRIEVCVLKQGRWYIAAGQGTEVILQ